MTGIDAICALGVGRGSWHCTRRRGAERSELRRALPQRHPRSDSDEQCHNEHHDRRQAVVHQLRPPRINRRTEIAVGARPSLAEQECGWHWFIVLVSARIPHSGTPGCARSTLTRPVTLAVAAGTRPAGPKPSWRKSFDLFASAARNLANRITRPEIPATLA
jgi:hypothetical protein